MPEPVKIEMSFSQVADAYQQFRPGYPQALYDTLAQWVPPVGECRALDVGCGTGNVTRELAKMYPFVYGIDPSEGMLTQARLVPVDSVNPISWTEGFAEDLPFEDRFFDLVTVAQAFHWFDGDRFLTACKRVLKTGGLVAIFAEGPASGMVYRSSIHKIIRDFREEGRQTETRRGPRKKPDELFVTHGFCDVEKRVIEYDLEWEIEAFVGFMNSMSMMADFNGAERETLNGLFHEKLMELTGGVKTFVEKNVTTLFIGKRSG